MRRGEIGTAGWADFRERNIGVRFYSDRVIFVVNDSIVHRHEKLLTYAF